jgi:hypothetical protein
MKNAPQYLDATFEVFMALCNLVGEYQHASGMCIHIQD